MNTIQRIGEFIENQGLSIRAFEQTISASNGLIRKAIANNTDIQSKWLSLIVENYPQLNTGWLLTGLGSMLKEDKPIQHTTSSITLVAKDEDSVRIPVVDISVAAGYGCYNDDYIDEVDCISLPTSMIKDSKVYLCVRVKGQSMAPSILDSGYLIIRKIDRSEWGDIRDGYVYVVSDTEGRSYVKRLKNRLRQYGFIVCMSDNADKQNYSNFNLTEDELNTVWYAEWYFSAKIPNIQETYYHKQTELEDRFDELSTQVQLISKAIKLM